MNVLLEKIIAAHGDSTWDRFQKVEATIVSGGGFFPLKGFLPDSNPPARAFGCTRKRRRCSLVARRICA